MFDFSWNSDDTHFITALVWSVVGFASYYFLSLNKSLTKKISRLNPGLNDQVKYVVLQRSWGLLFLGVMSCLIIALILKNSLADFGLGLSFYAAPPWWSYLSIPLIVVAVYFTSSKPGNLALYPQMRIKEWTPGILVLSSISWIFFLIAYEFLFRGFLLFSSLEVLKPWPAIALNCSIYAFAHFYKGPGETFGAIPLGFLLCYLTLITGEYLERGSYPQRDGNLQ